MAVDQDAVDMLATELAKRDATIAELSARVDRLAAGEGVTPEEVRRMVQEQMAIVLLTRVSLTEDQVRRVNAILAESAPA